MRTEKQSAFEALLERQGAFLYRVAFGLLRHAQDAEDTVQDALLKLFRGDGWRDLRDERAFLARVVWRLGLDRLQHRRTEDLDVSGMELAGNEPAADERMAAEGEHALLTRLVNALPEDLRRPLVLSAIDGMTSREAGALLGLPEATVRGRVLRAKTELKRRFEAATANKTEVGR